MKVHVHAYTEIKTNNVYGKALCLLDIAMNQKLFLKNPPKLKKKKALQ